MRNRFFPILACIVLAGVTALMPGCTTEQDVENNIAKIQAVIDQLKADVERRDAKIASLQTAINEANQRKNELAAIVASQPDTPAATNAQQTLELVAAEQAKAENTLASLAVAQDQARSDIATATADVEAARQDLAAARSESNAGTQLASTVGAFIPAALPLAGFFGLLYKHLRLAKSNKRLGAAATNVIQSVDWLSDVAPEVAAAFDKYQSELRAKQGAEGNLLVDIAQGKKPRTLEPIKV